MGSRTILLRSGLAALVLLSSPLPAGCSLEAEATVEECVATIDQASLSELK